MSVYSCFTAQRRALSIFSLAVILPLLALLTGCDNNDRDNIVPASSVEYSSARPQEIVESYNALKSNQPAQAFSSANNFLRAQPQSPYRAEALYLCGQSLAAQGDFQRGKKFHEEAIDSTRDRDLKALAMLGRADCNYGLANYPLASRQYHWLQTMYKDVKPLRADEVMFKLGMSAKKADNIDWANYWFNQVNELYNSGPYAERARAENTSLKPKDGAADPRIYTLEAYNFGSREPAEEAAATLRSKGYRDVQVIATTRNSFASFEVHVGKFSSRSEAGRAQVDAELAGLSTALRPRTVEPMK